MTETHERRISYKELTHLAFKCARCGIEMSFDLKNADQKRRLSHSQVTALKCPSCEYEFDRYFMKSFQGLRNWLDDLSALECEIIFRLPIAETAPSQRLGA